MIKPRKGVKEMKATLFRLDPDTHKALRIAAIEEGISMNEALTQAMQAWLFFFKQKTAYEMRT